MANAIIDACCLIDILASGIAEDILGASGFTWHIPSAVRGEVRYLRQRKAGQPGTVVQVAADVSVLLASGVLTACDPESTREWARFTHYTALFRSDGESMCLAIAEERNWVIATDDRRAINVAQQAGVTVVSCPQLVKDWADTAAPDEATILAALRDIELLAQFKPNQAMPQFQWWLDQLAKTGP
jgi:hypothetical protein